MPRAISWCPIRWFFAFTPGLIAWLVVPNFPLRHAARPGLAALAGPGKLLFMAVSLASLFAWWVLARQRRGAVLAGLWAVDAALAVLQVWAVFPGGV